MAARTSGGAGLSAIVGDSDVPSDAGYGRADRASPAERFAELPLSPLRPSAIASLVDVLLGEGVAQQPQIDEIVQRAMGNPLFAREYALLLASHRDQREFGLAAPTSARPRSNVAVPDTVQSLIASRLDALLPSEDLTLKCASVIGDTFSLQLLTAAFPGNAGNVSIQQVLDSLEQRQLIVRVPADVATYAFPHALIREVTYQQLTRDQRRDLHRRVAEAIELHDGGDLTSDGALLAHHWTLAEVTVETMRYSDIAATQALTAGAFAEADRLLSECIRLSKRDAHNIATADQIRWHRQVADARHGTGHVESRSAAAHQALRLAGLPRAHDPFWLALQTCYRTLRSLLRHVIAPTYTSAQATQRLEIARAFRHSAEACYFNNDLIGMICDDVCAVSYASRLGPSAAAGASAELGGILTVAGFRRFGERVLARAMADAEAAGDQASLAYAHMITCLYFVGTGDWSAAENSARRCQELCEPLDDRVNWTNAQAVRFWMSYYRSHDAAAYDAACGVRDRASETGNRQQRAWGSRFLALCALRSNEPQQAVLQLKISLESLGETAALNERLPALGVLAYAQFRMGDVWSARATAREGLAQARRVRRPIGHATLEGYSSLFAVALECWREERSPEWRSAMKLLLRLLRRHHGSFAIGEPRYHLHAGEYQRTAGATGAARESYQRGAAAAARLGMPWEEQRCREALHDLTA